MARVNTLEFFSGTLDGFNKPTAAIKAMLPSATDYSAGLQFWALDTGIDDLAQRMTISRTGNVGIGTTSPGSKLQVNGNAVIGYSASTAGPNNGLAISGNVGIGTAGPIAPLDIFRASAVNGPMLSIRSDLIGAGKYEMIRFGDQDAGAGYYQKGAIIYESVSNASRGRFHIALENTDYSDNVALSDAKVTVQSDGNVGIGTTSPSARLDVNSDIVPGAHCQDPCFCHGYRQCRGYLLGC